MLRIAAGLVCSIGIIACTQSGTVAERPADTPAATPPAATPPAPTTPPARADNGFTPVQQTEWNAIEALEAESKVIARVEGCASSGDCRTAPVGSRGCGGPRYYLPWCAKTTDSAALYAKLAQVSDAERAFNKKYSIGSTCELRLAPEVVSSGGSCITH